MTTTQTTKTPPRAISGATAGIVVGRTMTLGLIKGWITFKPAPKPSRAPAAERARQRMCMARLRAERRGDPWNGPERVRWPAEPKQRVYGQRARSGWTGRYKEAA